LVVLGEKNRNREKRNEVLYFAEREYINTVSDYVVTIMVMVGASISPLHNS